MKYIKLVMHMLIVLLCSICMLSSTLAQFSSENSGSDTAVIARWNFKVGNSEDNLQNVGFTFDVFNEQPLSPQDKGDNSFFISPGGSDVAIDYEVYMNVDVLMADVNGISGGTDYPPLIFYISSSSATVLTPYNSWFDLKNITTDSEGYFMVAEGQFDANSDELTPITINWWWNTSFYVGISNTDSSANGNYYKLATEQYQLSINQYNSAVNQANSFFEQHQRIVTTIDGVEQVSYNWLGEGLCSITEGAEGGDIDAAHFTVYDGLLASVDSAQSGINNSLKVQYDNYDTKALNVISNLQFTSPESILVKVVGKQVNPTQL